MVAVMARFFITKTRNTRNTNK